MAYLPTSVVEVTGFEPATFWSRKPEHESVTVRKGPLKVAVETGQFRTGSENFGLLFGLQ